MRKVPLPSGGIEVPYKANNACPNISVYTEMLGQALFALYGTSIPPDGSGTLRIGDGVLKSYSYNGTIAPTHTTFYGMYDRYYSFNKKTPRSEEHTSEL